MIGCFFDNLTNSVLTKKKYIWPYSFDHQHSSLVAIGACNKIKMQATFLCHFDEVKNPLAAKKCEDLGFSMNLLMSLIL